MSAFAAFFLSNRGSACEFVAVVTCVSFNQKLQFQTPNIICETKYSRISNMQELHNKLLIAQTVQNPGAMHAVPCMPLTVLLMACVRFCNVQFVSFHLISFSVLLFPFMSFICFACFPTMNVRNPAPAWMVETL